MYISLLFSLFFLCTLINVSLGVHDEGSGPLIEDEPLHQQCCASASSLVGTLTPILVPRDKYSKVNYEMIPTYLNFLNNNGIHGIILFSVETASFQLTQEEKKLVLSVTAKETRRLGLTLAVQVGVTDINDTIDLVRYAKKVGADAILCRPEVYYASPTVEGVVEYLQYVAKAAYPTRFLYSDPQFEDGLDYNTVRIVKALRARVKNFAGYRTSLLRALEIVAVLGNSNISVFSTDSANIVGPYAFCLNGSSTLIANIFPRYVVQAQQSALKGDYNFGMAIDKKINRVYFGCIATQDYDRYDRTLLGFVIQIVRYLVYIVNGIDLGGAATIPLPNLTLQQQMQCYRICQREGVAKYNPRNWSGYKNNQNNNNGNGNDANGNSDYVNNNQNYNNGNGDVVNGNSDNDNNNSGSDQGNSDNGNNQD